MLTGNASQARVDPTDRALALSEDLPAGALKQRLQSCADGAFSATEFSIAHRGAPLGYPEHSREGYIAAAKMGAGVIECDVTFTQDLELVCRHSQCDLASSTNIL
ncbi:MAG: glycerophosphodiester phosphodiesterase family protein, partial [Pseudomonadota bacterium]|nr:glycerophosphodiester phosphodiesterase family protein [Pseudomonadota bacterium]MEC7974579.1 glycerophosphodiester phosphodiesterase family protein [Pseudomonadota bacterium]MEC8059483.1 glycerophosphodiester phosphodiesterase family protein [Pseudomonadota bacterium]MEE3174905.1 glycerophosphodiester phosphodiesterase family protein [Pseudomonadota bacterium]